ncbi:uncharacterized protein [Parasteatoda tepidariorum]|uniref:uncharacterized protein isoform X3 n=1 Tax=Parasteatoda tepidariorum TaxID=114398 RepID=UPI001C71D1E0|nr:uncharacterized protein LOC107442831 isoform X2 [Parasteatoda tepidariorum]
MKWFTGLVFCIVVGLAVSEEEVDYLSNYYCYLAKVFKFRLNADYSGGWCKYEPTITKYQIQAAEECQTGFADVARKYYDNLNEVCTEGLKGKCGRDMFTDIGKECFQDYYNDLGKPGSNPFDPLESERVLCKHIDTMMACQFTKVEEQCKNEYPVFLRVMTAFVNLQHSVCAIIPDSS